MSNSDEQLEMAIRAHQRVLGISESDAKYLIQTTFAYTSRFNAEVMAQEGPAWELVKEYR